MSHRWSGSTAAHSVPSSTKYQTDEFPREATISTTTDNHYLADWTKGSRTERPQHFLKIDECLTSTSIITGEFESLVGVTEHEQLTLFGYSLGKEGLIRWRPSIELWLREEQTSTILESKDQRRFVEEKTFRLTVNALVGDEEISRFVGTFMNELLSENHFTLRDAIAKFSDFMRIIHNTITRRRFTPKWFIVIVFSTPSKALYRCCFNADWFRPAVFFVP